VADSIREQIITKIVAKVKTVSSLQRVYRAYRNPLIDVDEDPAVVVNDRGDQSTWHLRKAYEHVMTVDLQIVVHKGDDAERATKVNNLLADVQKVVEQNQTWDSLAISTEIRSNSPSIGEVVEPLGVDRLVLSIVYRVQETDPYTAQVVG